MPSTIERCLARLGLAIASLAGCDDLDAEWAAVKRAYFKTALKTHPDKGGDASAFRKVQGAFDPNPNPNPNHEPNPNTSPNPNPNPSPNPTPDQVQGAFEALRKAYDRGCAWLVLGLGLGLGLGFGR